MITRAVATPQPSPLDLRIESLAIAGDARRLRGLALVDYVRVYCLAARVDVLREQVAARVNAMCAAGRLATTTL